VADQGNPWLGGEDAGRGRRLHRRVCAAGGLLVGLLVMALLASSAQAASVPLGTAANFAVLAGSTVTNAGASVIRGDVGVSPGSAVTGFGPGTVVPPSVIYRGGPIALQAKNDLTTAYNNVAGRSLSEAVFADLGGRTLAPGVYSSASSLALNGDLTLDAKGDPNAEFVFQAGSTLLVGTTTVSHVRLINGAQASNVYWQVGSSATIGVGSAFAGNILALTSITMKTSATLDGRALAQNGAVTLDTTTITTPAIAPVPPPQPPGGTPGGGGKKPKPKRPHSHRPPVSRSPSACRRPVPRKARRVRCALHLWIQGIEITQGTSGLNLYSIRRRDSGPLGTTSYAASATSPFVDGSQQAVRLIASKPTLARVYGRYAGTTSPPPNGATVTLTATTAQGKRLPGRPSLRQRFPANAGPGRRSIEPRRADPSQSWNIPLPAAWTRAGQINVTASISAKRPYRECAGCRNQANRAPLHGISFQTPLPGLINGQHVAQLPLTLVWTTWQGDTYPPVGAPDAAVALGKVNALYPLAPGAIVAPFQGPLQLDHAPTSCEDFIMQFMTAIGQRYGDANVTQPATAGAPKYLGLSNAWGNGTTPCGGIAYLSGRAAMSLPADVIIAQELGHNFGLQHVGQAAPPPGHGQAAPPPLDPWPNETGALNGYGMSGAGLDRAYSSTPIIYAPDDKYPTGPDSPAGPTFDFMSYASPPWVSPNRWNGLIDLFANPANQTGGPANPVAAGRGSARSAGRAAGAPRTEVVSAYIADERNPAHTRGRMTAPVTCPCRPSPPSPKAQYQFALLDASGRILKKIGAPIGHLDTGGAIAEIAFTSLPRASTIKLLADGRTITSAPIR